LGPTPAFLAPILERLVAEGVFPERPDQIIVNEYLPGQGIAPHVDCIPCFGPVIASLSLGSACEIAFSQERTGQREKMILEPRSLLVLAGEARSQWRHAIAHRKSDVIEGKRAQRLRRISLTFRTCEVF